MDKAAADMSCPKCENCRHRKVRCDRTHPCGQCSRKQFQCTYPAGYKPRAKQKPVRLSQGCEHKLDEISKKIDLICLSVDRLGSLPGHAAAMRRTASPIASASLPVDTPSFTYTASNLPESHDSDDGSASDLGGDVALAAQAAFATNLAETLVDRAHPLGDLPEVKSSLVALRRSLAAANERSIKASATGSKPSSPVSGVEGCNLPPMQISMAALQRLRESIRLKLFWSMEFDSVGQFVEYFMTVYSGKPSLADMIIVHCGLHRLFIECGNEEHDACLKNEFYAQGALCKDNLTATLSTIPFNLPATFDFALALYMTSTYYLETCKLSMAWSALVMASQMCRTLGYNREVLTTDETSQSKKRRTKLFWSIYSLDKMVALRLNRPSSLRDDDITLHMLEPASSSSDEILAFFPGWIDVARLHGKIYDDIYSLGALAKPADERDARAREIAAGLKRIFASTGAFDAYLAQLKCEATGGTIYDILARAERIYQLSTLTLVYRGIRPCPGEASAFCAECVDTANQCLEEHRACLSILKDAELSIIELYVQWALLCAPFIPFIVIFCYIIETRDQTHLGKLSAVVETLQLLPPSLPDGYRKQLRLFKLMYDVACKYLNISTDVPLLPAVQRAADMPFEMLYSEAGMPLPGRLDEQPYSTAAGDAHDNMVLSDYSAELGYWFDQNHHVFKMLEDTL